MHYLKRNTIFCTTSFLSIILTPANYIQIPIKTDIYFPFIKIPKKNIFKNLNEYFTNRLCSLNDYLSFTGCLKCKKFQIILVSGKNLLIIEDRKFNFDFNKLIIDSKFNDIIDELKSINISLTTVKYDVNQDLNTIKI